jgi:hypothetical protein
MDSGHTAFGVTFIIIRNFVALDRPTEKLGYRNCINLLSKTYNLKKHLIPTILVQFYLC